MYWKNIFILRVILIFMALVMFLLAFTNKNITVFWILIILAIILAIVGFWGKMWLRKF